jgi:hypothetical protein
MCLDPFSARQNFLILSAVSRDLLNALPPPGRCLEGIPEILCFVDDLGRGSNIRIRLSLLFCAP